MHNIILRMLEKVLLKISYEKVYKQGFNINTPINLNLQKIATKSLRDGLIFMINEKVGWSINK